jgi:hypothetical protein
VSCFFRSSGKGTVLSNNPVEPSFIAYMVNCVRARIVAALLWPLHNLAKILVYKKIHSSIGISKVHLSCRCANICATLIIFLQF